LTLAHFGERLYILPVTKHAHPALGQSDNPLVYLSSHYIQTKEYLEAIVASTSDAICTTDMQGHVIFFNPGAERLLGLSSSEVVGRPVYEMYENGREEAKKIMKMLLKSGSFSDYASVLQGKGRKIHVSISGAFLKDRSGKRIGMVGISKDITERVELEQRLRELSITDNLTGLFNQRHFRERAVAEILRTKRQRSKLSLILIDLDHFKNINDTLGHLEGDRTLRQVAKTISKSIRGEVDTVFRYGGDEFVVLLPGSGLRKAEMVARRIQQAMESQKQATQVSMSFGVACLKPNDSVDDLLHRADERMYRAKKARK
jgi:diguanylate cyclase (GGDEF)-like protein/PAS domain S-box-containing protein